jgi:16S rRNA (uracil1498-N3)-methyltransferase
MKRFILPGPPGDGGLIRLSGGDYHYLARVRRLAPGAWFDARLPTGEPVRVRVRSVAGDCLTGECLPAGESSAGEAAGDPGESAPGGETLSLPPILLFQALPKGAKMDLIVRQAAEGGLTEIAPFVSAHSVPRPESFGPRLERWRRIIKEARQQSGSPVATSVRPPCAEPALLAYWDSLRAAQPQALGILLHQEPLEKGTFHGYLGTKPPLVAIAVGPEGGFSGPEAARFVRAGFKPLLLGDTILRTETAALYAAAAIRVILLERSTWIPLTPPV